MSVPPITARNAAAEDRTSLDGLASTRMIEPSAPQTTPQSPTSALFGPTRTDDSETETVDHDQVVAVVAARNDRQPPPVRRQRQERAAMERNTKGRGEDNGVSVRG